MTTQQPEQTLDTVRATFREQVHTRIKLCQNGSSMLAGHDQAKALEMIRTVYAIGLIELSEVDDWNSAVFGHQDLEATAAKYGVRTTT